MAEARTAADVAATLRSNNVRANLSSRQLASIEAAIAAAALEHGISPRDVIGRSLSPRCCRARKASYGRIVTALPEVSVARIARAVGRHHTTILGALGRRQERPSTSDEALRLWRSGKDTCDIAAALGIREHEVCALLTAAREERARRKALHIDRNNRRETL